MIFGYSRISKGDDQNARLQIKAFKEAGVEKTFEENASGGRWDRPALHAMLDQLRKDDVVVVWKLDRLSRSLKDLLVIMEKIDNAGAGFKSLTESIDTTKAGLDAARAEGRVGGRRPKLRDDQKKDIIENVLSGRKTGAQMARLYNVSEATISRIVAKHRQPIT